ncbi:hypothetical protein BABINDRAFT_162692 [Babjeviella inositovora NRRL Y-12698]|uniref:RING-type domain-containing protein n=1 Tax=Babjeviella inositovora NRRL Y-12698 TaxID=984486 RepID=A0A1E3QLF4_9ASCO|nr:uncharacterized protein BABINDRAFT_162692 [Babjeviella inositovora NRRL Y-12698]ODQ78480.1 hypothetical protein BABINDRAFT_162692 [Babjeviella inositovora NRRL Y-12698]
MSDDDSDDSLTMDLEQVGRFSFSAPSFAHLDLQWGTLPKYHDIPSLVTSFTTRTQMWNVLNDLDVGVSIQTALERLKPIQKVIQDAIQLRLDEGETEGDNTEPIGVEPLVESRGIPIMEDVVAPKDARWEGFTPTELSQLVSFGPDEDLRDEAVKRSKIRGIQQHTKLNDIQKGQLINKLMMGEHYYLDTRLETPGTPGLMERIGEDRVHLSAQDKIPSYHNEEKGVLGCSHYQRNCKIECSRCQKWYPCRFCHDSDPHNSCKQLIRKETRHILCQRCFTPQEPSETCVNCEATFALYFCAACVLYDNDPYKDIYHCDGCGICRLGLGLGKDFYHCKGCNACISTSLQSTHKCLEQSTARDCPICNEFMFTSTKTVVFMPCGHAIHQQCYNQHTKHSYKCPICTRTILNMEAQFRVLDQEIENMPMPGIYSSWRCFIQCIDCGGRSECLYHILGLKCGYCRSYNTTQNLLIKPEEGGEVEVETTGNDSGIIRSGNTLSQNFNQYSLPASFSLLSHLNTIHNSISLLSNLELSANSQGEVIERESSDDDLSDGDILQRPNFLQSNYAGFMSFTSPGKGEEEGGKGTGGGKKGASLAEVFKKWMSQAVDDAEEHSGSII